MTPQTLIPQSINVTYNDDNKTEYSFYSRDLSKSHKCITIYKIVNIIETYPYNYNRTTDVISPKKISKIIFEGWSELRLVPNCFKKDRGLGPGDIHIKTLLNRLYRIFPEFNKLTISKNKKSKFTKYSITLNWGDLQEILKILHVDKTLFNNNRINKTNYFLNKLNSNKFHKTNKNLTSKHLESFLAAYDTFELNGDISNDIIKKILHNSGKKNITITENYLISKNEVETVFLDSIIKDFENNLSKTNSNERDWQSFLNKYAWIFVQILPYNVIITNNNAYLGGQKMEGDSSNFVDFILRNDLNDNCALVEIKHHNTKLLKDKPYRNDNVFSMTDEFSGAISQLINYKDTLIKNYAYHKMNNSDIKVFDPACLLIIGNKMNLTDKQRECFELVKNSYKDVVILTFDELKRKLTTLSEILKYKK